MFLRPSSPDSMLMPSGITAVGSKAVSRSRVARSRSPRGSPSASGIIVGSDRRWSDASPGSVPSSRSCMSPTPSPSLSRSSAVSLIGSPSRMSSSSLAIAPRFVYRVVTSIATVRRLCSQCTWANSRLPAPCPDRPGMRYSRPIGGLLTSQCGNRLAGAPVVLLEGEQDCGDVRIANSF